MVSSELRQPPGAGIARAPGGYESVGELQADRVLERQP